MGDIEHIPEAEVEKRIATHRLMWALLLKNPEWKEHSDHLWDDQRRFLNREIIFYDGQNTGNRLEKAMEKEVRIQLPAGYGVVPPAKEGNKHEDAMEVSLAGQLNHAGAAPISKTVPRELNALGLKPGVDYAFLEVRGLSAGSDYYLLTMSPEAYRTFARESLKKMADPKYGALMLFGENDVAAIGDYNRQLAEGRAEHGEQKYSSFSNAIVRAARNARLGKNDLEQVIKETKAVPGFMDALQRAANDAGMGLLAGTGKYTGLLENKRKQGDDGRPGHGGLKDGL